MVDRFHAAILFAQDGIETGVGFTGLFRRKSGGGEGRVQLGLVLPVFPCGFRQVEEALGQPGEGGAGGGNSGTRRDRQAFEDGADLLQLAGSLIGLVGCVIDLIPELVRLLGGIPHLIAHGVDGPLVLVKLPLHVVQSGLGVVELDLPLLGASVVLPERGGSVLQRLTQSFDLFLLGIDLLTQHLVPGGEGFHGIIVFIKLGLHDLHFGAENLKGLVDVRQCLLEFLFALQPDFQAKVIRHPWSPPSNPVGNHIVNGQLSLGLRHTEELLVALPQIQQQAEGQEHSFLRGKAQLGGAVIEKPGKQLGVCYPTSTFFESVSLSIFRLVPLYMASMMASLYPASSKGEVSSSTASWVSGSFLSSGCWRLWISTL